MTLTAAPALRLPGIDPGPHVPHWLHGSGRLYPETNCYTDVLIELLHARGDEPLAVLGSTLAGDFQGDQWTFFKPDPADLRDLFGVGVHEQMPSGTGPPRSPSSSARAARNSSKPTPGTSRTPRGSPTGSST